LRVRERRLPDAESVAGAIAVLWMPVALLAWAAVVTGGSLPSAPGAAARFCLAYGWAAWLAIVAAGIVLGAVRVLERGRSR
jgi:hypothetical protein